jgi:hypothetical protein
VTVPELSATADETTTVASSKVANVKHSKKASTGSNGIIDKKLNGLLLGDDLEELPKDNGNEVQTSRRGPKIDENV